MEENESRPAMRALNGIDHLTACNIFALDMMASARGAKTYVMLEATVVAHKLARPIFGGSLISRDQQRWRGSEWSAREWPWHPTGRN